MHDTMTYRLMDTGEAQVVHQLILDAFHQHVAPTYSQAGIETFLGMLSIDFLKGTGPEQITAVADHNGQLVGVLSVIQAHHIALLFVRSDYQGMGIGKRLIRFGIDLCLQRAPSLDAMTVSSTPNSLTFYERCGFRKMGTEQNENGMRFIPMRKKMAGDPV